MPPKGSGKNRKKAAVVESVENGTDIIEDKHEAGRRIRGEQKGLVPSKIVEKITRGKARHIELPENSKSDLNGDLKSEINIQEPGSVSRPVEKLARQDSTDVLSEKVAEENIPKTRSRRNGKQESAKVASEKDVQEEPLPEAKNNAPKKTRNAQNLKQQVTNSAPERSNTKDNKTNTELEEAENIVHNNKKKRGGKLQQINEATEFLNSNKEASKTEEKVLLVDEEVIPKRRGRGKNAKQQAIDIDSEKIDLKFDLNTEKTEEPKTEEVVLKKTRGGRTGRQQLLTQEAKEDQISHEESKQKNIQSEKDAKKSSKRQKTHAGQTSETVITENRELKVSLLREKSVDEMAIAELIEKEPKMKVAKGPSKTAGRGKRGRDDDSDTKPAKVPKQTSSKSSKREKIADVTVLDFSNTSTSPKGESWNLKMASWNINGIRAWLEKDGLSYLHHEKPDILCVQETKCSDEKLPEEATVEGYQCYWLAGDKEGYSGVGLLSKEKPLSVEYGIGVENHDQEGRVITAEYEKFYLVSAYVPNSGRGLVRLDYRMQWDKDFSTYLVKLDQKKPVILCGDLNVAHREIDLANPKTNKKNAGFTKEERDGFSTLLSEGFVDTFRHLYPDRTGAYTFWTYMMNARAKNVGWRLDYFVISEQLIDNLCDCVIRKDVLGSDHCPLTLFMRF